MKIKIFRALIVGAVFSTSGANAAELSPLFKIGQPGWHSFSTTASGYGALGENQSHVAVYVSLAESRQVQVGAEADVRLGPPEGMVAAVTGRVTSILADADPTTGQAIVSIQIPLQREPARTYASASIQTTARRALAIPSSALLMIGGQPFVFRQKADNNFEKTPIVIGDQLMDFIEIKNGLKETDNILVEGAPEWAYKDSTAGDE